MKNTTRFSVLLLGLILYSCLSMEETVSFDSDFEGNEMKEAPYKERRGGFGDRIYDVQFNRVRVDGSFKVEVMRSRRDEVLVSAPARLQDKIIVENNGRELYIHFKSGELIKSKSGAIRIRIYARSLSTLKANSSANIVLVDPFGADKIDISASSNGKIYGDFDARKIILEVESTSEFEGDIRAGTAILRAKSNGKIYTSGRVQEVEATARSLGRIEAEHLTAERAELKAEDKGDILMTISRQGHAITSSNGSIRLRKRGNAVITKEGNVRIMGYR